MPTPKQCVRQRDFSGGEVVEWAKRRDDEAIIRASARDMQNATLLATGTAENRPGRSILFSQDARVDEVRMSPTATYRLCFGAGTLTIRDDAGAIVTTNAGYAWGVADVDTIVWDRFDNDVIITFPGQIPKIARWDGAVTWTFLDFAFDVIGTQKQIAFLRIAPKGMTLLPSGTSGSVTITFSANYLVAGMIGNIIRYHESQMEITGVTNPLSGTATVKETITSNRQTLNFAVIFSTPAVNDIVTGASFGAAGRVITVGGTSLLVELIEHIRFVGSDNIFLAGGGFVGTTTTVVDAALAASVIWDEEVTNAFRGWPRSVTVDQNRLIFCDFPGVPMGISWSAIGLSTDHAVGASPDDGFFELAPKRSRVYHVAGGAD